MIPRLPACLRSVRPNNIANRCKTVVTVSSSYKKGAKIALQPKKSIIGKTIQNRRYAGSVFIKPDRKPEFKQVRDKSIDFVGGNMKFKIVEGHKIDLFHLCFLKSNL